MRRVIITGGPGVGKTTLLRALEARGYAVVEESAREIIRERKAEGLPPRPDAAEFAAEILRRDTMKYEQTPDLHGWVFFDRSPLEAIAMLQEATVLAPEEIRALVIGFSFHRVVFVLPPWPEIYVQDAERDHSFRHCMRVHEEIVAWYGRLGYEVAEVPPQDAGARASHVLRVLASRVA